MTIEQTETHAYLAGDTDKAALLARIADLEMQVEELTEKLDDAESCRVFGNISYPMPRIGRSGA